MRFRYDGAMGVLQADTVVAGRYRLLHELGEGGMGSVWVAYDKKLRRPVALKMLKHGYLDSGEALTRFEREAMAVARLRSPNIVELHDYGIHEGAPYMVMELLEGRDLSAKLKRAGRLRLDVVARIVGQVAKALTVAHDQGIVHRDLKPANVFLVRAGEEEIVKVFDFGIAKLAREDDGVVTVSGALVGTPAYMSP